MKRGIVLLVFLCTIGLVVAVDIDACQALNSGVYTVNQTVNASGTCFTFSQDNIYLDCDGHTIEYDKEGAGNTVGVRSQSRDNTTIVNCVIHDVNASGSTAYGVGVFGGDDVEIMNNTIQTNSTSSGIGVSVTLTTNNVRVVNNTIRTAGTIFGNIGIFTNDADNLSISGNSIFTSGTSGLNTAIHLISSSNGLIVDNYAQTTGAGGNDGLSLNDDSLNITVLNNRFNLSGSLSAGVEIYSAGATFINNIFENCPRWIENNQSTQNLTNTTFSTQHGSIFYPQLAFTTNESVLQSNLDITANNVFVNSSEISDFNTSATVTLRNTGFFGHQLLVDYEDDGTFVNCDICTEVSDVANTVVFTVQHFTSFSSAEFVDPVPEFSTIALMLLLVVTLGGFVVMRRRD